MQYFEEYDPLVGFVGYEGPTIDNITALGFYRYKCAIRPSEDEEEEEPEPDEPEEEPEVEEPEEEKSDPIFEDEEEIVEVT